MDNDHIGAARPGFIECHELITRIYDLPLRPDSWTDVLDRFAHAVGGVSSTLHAFDPVYTEHRVRERSSNYDIRLSRHDMTFETFNERVVPDEMPAIEQLARLKERGFRSDIELHGVKDAGALDALPSVQAFKTLLGVTHRAASPLNIMGVWSDFLTIEFASDDLNDIRSAYDFGNLFLDHFAKAVELGRAFSVLRQRFNGVLTALDHFRIGVLVLGPGGSVVLKNEEARRIVEDCDGLVMTRQHYLETVSAEMRGQLRTAVARAVSTAKNGHRHSETFLTVPRRSGLDGYLLEVVPIRSEEVDPGFGGAMVFVIDPTHTEVVSTKGMQTLYNLTASEAEICKLLALGENTEDVAEKRGLTRETVRTYIKQILQKTGVGNRSELVRLALKVNLPIEHPVDMPNEETDA